MKKILLFFFLSLLMFSFSSLAQNWVTGGNKLTANGSLGTTSNFSVLFKSNNTERGRLTNSGLWGFGTTSPASKLQINSSTGQNPFSVQINGSTKLLVHSGGGVAVGSSSTPPANGLYVSGNVGIGTSTPLSKLHIKGNGTDAYAGLGITNTNSGGKTLTINQGTPGKLNFTEPGILDLMTMDFTNGNVGIGTTNPGKYKLKISYNNDNIIGGNGIDIENTATGFEGGRGDWEIYTAPQNRGSSGQLDFFYDGNLQGYLSPGGGFGSVSDRRLKMNIKPMPGILNKILQLKPSTYQFKDDKKAQEYNGFIAQDVLNIFPDLVTHQVNPQRQLDVYGLNYNGFGVLAIKGIQELTPMIEEQKDKMDSMDRVYKLKITTLEERINKLETALSNIIANKNINTSITTNFSLEQNNPNPFNKNTIIRYRIPQGSNGQIDIYDAAGKQIKSIIANEGGQAELSAFSLRAGTYTYSLIVDGQIATSRQMVIMK